MKNDYVLRLAFDDGSEKRLSFHTARSKIDRLFFDFAFCIPCSNIACVDLFLIPSVKCNVVDCEQLINRAHKVGFSDSDFVKPISEDELDKSVLKCLYYWATHKKD